MGGSPKPATSTTTINNPQQQALYNQAMPFLNQFATNPPQLPKGPLNAPFDPSQTAGQNMVLNAASGPQQQIANTGLQSSQFLSGDVLHPGTNPALQEYMASATKPLYQNLTEQVLPSVRSESVGHNVFGGTRQGIAEGLASGRTAQAAGNVTADIANQGYKSGLDAMVKNLALLPQTSQLQLAPGLSTSGVGDVRRSLAQALLGETNLRELYPQLLPLIMGQTLAGIGSGIQPQGSTTVGTASQQSPIMQALGLGISGLGALGSAGGAGGIGSLFSSLGGGLGALGAGAGEGIAALLPFLAMSDRRLKRRIRLIGHLLNGVPLYRFRFRGSEVEHVGFMADRVPPDCVVDVLGFKAVDYGKVLAWRP